MSTASSLEDIQILGPLQPGFDTILTPDALRFVADLHRRHNARRLELLHQRQLRQQKIDQGQLPDFLPELACYI